jgi:hypothetical protein
MQYQLTDIISPKKGLHHTYSSRPMRRSAQIVGKFFEQGYTTGLS